MFAKLQRKILFTIVGATIFFIAAISLVTAFVIGRNYRTVYEESIRKSVQIAIDYSGIKIASILSDGETLAVDETISAGLIHSGYVTTINPKLNFFRSQYQEAVFGLTLYATNGQVYKTDSLPIAGITPWDELVQNPEVAAFVASADPSALVLLPSRTDWDAIRSLGILIRISDGISTTGYLLIMVDSAYLFGKYFDYSNVHDFVLVNSFLSVGDTVYFPSEQDLGTEGLGFIDPEGNPEGYFADGGQKYIVTDLFFRPEYHVVTIVDAAPLHADILTLSAILVSAGIVFVALSWFIGKKEAASIASRLSNLQMRMKNATELIE